MQSIVVLHTVQFYPYRTCPSLTALPSSPCPEVAAIGMLKRSSDDLLYHLLNRFRSTYRVPKHTSFINSRNFARQYRLSATIYLTLARADQDTRRAFRTLGDPMEHRSTFIATEEELLLGDAGSPVWQQCGSGNNSFLPESIDPDVPLDDITGWLGRRAENAAEYRLQAGPWLGRPSHTRPGRAVSQPDVGDDARTNGAVRELTGRQTHPRRKAAPGPAGRLAPVRHQPTGRVDGRLHPQTGQPGALFPSGARPDARRRAAARADRRGADVPWPAGAGPPRGKSWAWSARPSRHNPHAYADRPA